jgi:hypothetical protein
MNFDKRFSNELFTHYQMNKLNVDKNVDGQMSTKNLYFSIDRPSSFKHDHWKDEMSAQVLLEIIEYIYR